MWVCVRYLRQFLTHAVLPAVLRRHFWDKNPVSSAGQGAHHGQVSAHTCRSLINMTISSYMLSFLKYFEKSLPAVPAHHFQHKRPLVAGTTEQTSKTRRITHLQTDLWKPCLFLSSLVICSPLCGGHDGVHHLNDAMQGRVGADGHVGAAEVVVNGADHTDDVELRVFLGGVLIDQT